MCAELICSSAILPKKNPHPQKQLATAHAANPSARLFSKTAIPPLSHTQRTRKKNTTADLTEFTDQEQGTSNTRFLFLNPFFSAKSAVALFSVYQTRQLFTGTIGDPFLHPNAAANPG